MRIIRRTEWGGGPVRQTGRVLKTAVQEISIHYDGAHYRNATGPQVPRSIERIHRAQGWSDIGYNFVIDVAGNIYEGRGWEVRGAHSGTNYGNRQLGVQLHIGGNQAPTEAQLTALVWLYRQARDRYGRWLRPRGHSDYIATSCPGPHKAAIMRRLTDAQTETPNQERDWFDMATEKQLEAAVERVLNRVLWQPVVDPKANAKAKKHVIGSSWRNNLWAIHNKLDQILAALSSKK